MLAPFLKRQWIDWWHGNQSPNCARSDLYSVLLRQCLPPQRQISLKGICIMSDMRERHGCQCHARLKQTPLPTLPGERPLPAARVPADQRQAHSTRHQPVWAQNSWHSHSPSHLLLSRTVCSPLPRHMCHISLTHGHTYTNTCDEEQISLALMQLALVNSGQKYSGVPIHLAMIKASKIPLRRQQGQMVEDSVF